jgi:hypothetical protein
MHFGARSATPKNHDMADAMKNSRILGLEPPLIIAVVWELQCRIRD